MLTTGNNGGPSKPEDTESVHNVLISFSYRAERRLPDSTCADRLRILAEQSSAVPIASLTYHIPYMIDPRDVALTDVWLKLSHEDRHYIYTQMPDLYRAIFLILKGEEA